MSTAFICLTSQLDFWQWLHLNLFFCLFSAPQFLNGCTMPLNQSCWLWRSTFRSLTPGRSVAWPRTLETACLMSSFSTLPMKYLRMFHLRICLWLIMFTVQTYKWKKCLCVRSFCTSIVAQDTNGTVYHGRNLDYPHDTLRNMTFNAVFLRKGKVKC